MPRKSQQSVRLLGELAPGINFSWMEMNFVRIAPHGNEFGFCNCRNLAGLPNNPKGYTHLSSMSFVLVRE